MQLATYPIPLLRIQLLTLFPPGKRGVKLYEDIVPHRTSRQNCKPLSNELIHVKFGTIPKVKRIKKIDVGRFLQINISNHALDHRLLFYSSLLLALIHYIRRRDKTLFLWIFSTTQQKFVLLIFTTDHNDPFFAQKIHRTKTFLNDCLLNG